MRITKIVVRVVVAVIGLPVALVLIMVLSYYLTFYSLQRTNGSIVSSGQSREYLLYVPRSYNRTKPTPLVISLHAAPLWPARQRETTHRDSLADEHGFIVVYPARMTPWGTGTGVWPRIWLLRPEAALTANIRFISDLIDPLQEGYNIDPARIYANGFSNGGAMAFALSCRLSHRIAAIGTVSAAQDQEPFSWCAEPHPTPLINFHGTADLVPYNGGKVRLSPKPFPSVLTWTADWARRNRCGPSPGDSLVAPGVTRLKYTHCANDATVVLYTLRGGGHSWPGGRPLPKWLVGPTNGSVDATREMWAFFREHPLRRL